jgi:hypothetical protein
MARQSTNSAIHEVPSGIDPTDLAALELAMKMSRTASPDRCKQLDAMLEDGRPWIDVAEFAAYDQQMDNLHLKPWQVPPLHVDDPNNPGAGEGEAAALLRRMLRAGVSRWHPDPNAAAIAAEREKSP